MLSKQGQKMMHDHESFLFKCFKARYFPRCHFLDLVDSSNSLYVWKSIMSAIPILRSGCYWRVGNVESIRVSTDKWLPNYPSNKILHPVNEEGEEWRVLDLIDLDLHWWRWDIIMERLNRDEAKAICKIPPSQRYVLDSIIWLHKKKGFILSN